LSHAEAREWIVTHYGTQFDPEVVEAFVAREQEFIRLSQANGAAGRQEEAGATADVADQSEGVGPVPTAASEVLAPMPG
jgi:hypothetical protein